MSAQPGRRFLAAMSLALGPVVRDSAAVDAGSWIAVAESEVWAEMIADALNLADRGGELWVDKQSEQA